MALCSESCTSPLPRPPAGLCPPHLPIPSLETSGSHFFLEAPAPVCTLTTPAAGRTFLPVSLSRQECLRGRNQRGPQCPSPRANTRSKYPSFVGCTGPLEQQPEVVSRDIVQKLLCHNTEIPVVTFKGIRTSGLLTGKDLKRAAKSQRSCFPGQQGITPLWTLCVVAPEHQGNIGGREGTLGSAVLSLGNG